VFTGGHQRFWDTARRKAGDRDGTKALIGVLLLHRTLAHRGGARRDRRSGGGLVLALKFGTGVIRAGVGDPCASFVTPSPISCHRTCPPGQPCPSRSVDEHPRGEASFADRAWSSRGRPATGSGVWCSGLSWGLRLRSPPSWVSGVDPPSPGRDHPLLAPRGIPPIPGARSNRHRGAISS
jgi:hypothetical protein